MKKMILICAFGLFIFISLLSTSVFCEKVEIKYIGPKVIEVNVGQKVDLKSLIIFSHNNKSFFASKITGDYNLKISGDYFLKSEYCEADNCVKEIVILRVKDILEHKVISYLKNVPFEEKVVERQSLKTGVEIIEQQGVNGLSLLKATAYYINGIKVGQSSFVETELTKVVDQIIAKGQMSHRQVKKEVRREVVPFKTIYQNDINVEYGQQKEIVAGEVGYVEVVENVTYVDNQEVERVEVSRSQVKDPKTRVIARNKDSQSIGTEKNVFYAAEVVPFEKITVKDNGLPQGYEEVRQPGTEGLMIVGLKKGVDGELVEFERFLSVEPINELIVVGTKEDINKFNYQYHSDVLPFYQYFQLNTKLKSDEYVVKYPGIVGFVERKYKINLVNEQEVSRELIEEKADSGFDQLIEYGFIDPDNQLVLMDSVFNISVVVDKRWFKGDNVDLLVTLNSDNVRGVYGNSFNLNFVVDSKKVALNFPIEVRIPIFTGADPNKLELYDNSSVLGLSLLDYRVDNNVLVTRVINPSKITLVHVQNKFEKKPKFNIKNGANNFVYEGLAVLGICFLLMFRGFIYLKNKK